MGAVAFGLDCFAGFFEVDLLIMDFLLTAIVVPPRILDLNSLRTYSQLVCQITGSKSF